jgi:hypothetical protein
VTGTLYAAAWLLCFQVVELQDMVDWLTNVQHVIKGHEGQINPTPQDLPRGVLDPKVQQNRQTTLSSSFVCRNSHQLHTAAFASMQTGHQLLAELPAKGYRALLLSLLSFFTACRCPSRIGLSLVS